ncbi:MAG TPA: MFS transporter [Chloroflexia bacterium]|nr:MFS transporter [Chloroflexia bacterium]
MHSHSLGIAIATPPLRLAWHPLHRRLILTAGLGWMFDGLDLALISFMLVGLSRDWGFALTTPFLGLSWVPIPALILSAGLLGMVVGGRIGGLLADRFGRKPVFQGTLLLYSVATGLCALIPGPAVLGLAGSAGLLAGLRFLVGVGLGAEFPAANALVSEWASTRQRGPMLTLVESFWPLGQVLAAVAGLVLIAGLPGGWRWAAALGALPALYVFYLRRHLPESPRYLAQTGQVAAAQAALRAVGLPAAEIALATAPAPLAAPARSLLAGPLARRSVLLWGTWAGALFGFYGISSWLPTLLGEHSSLLAGFGLLLIGNLASLPGTLVTVWLLPRWGRRPTMIVALLGAALGAGLFWLPVAGGLSLGATATEIWSVACFSLIAFSSRCVAGATYTYTAELYPTRLRGRGVGAAAAWGRGGAAIGPYVAGLWLGTSGLGGPLGLFLLFAGIFGACALAVAVFGEETGHQALEESASSVH